MASLYRQSLLLKVLLPLLGALLAVAIPILHSWATQPSADIPERRIGLLVFLAVIGFIIGSGFYLLYRVTVLPRQFRKTGVACLRCGYALRALPRSGECPECGVHYDRAATFQVWREHLSSHRRNVVSR